MFDRRLVQNFDWLLITLVAAITAIGLVNLYSAGFNRAPGTTPLYLKQLYWLALGTGLMLLTLFYDYRHLEKLAARKVNIVAADAVAAGKGRYGMILWVKAKDYSRAARALRAR